MILSPSKKLHKEDYLAFDKIIIIGTRLFTRKKKNNLPVKIGLGVKIHSLVVKKDPLLTN